MAIQGTVRDVYSIESVETTGGELEDHLVDVNWMLVVDKITSTAFNRFPTPPTAGGFLTDLDELPYFMPQDKVVRSIGGILAPSGDILEPRIGQIWPR